MRNHEKEELLEKARVWLEAVCRETTPRLGVCPQASRTTL